MNDKTQACLQMQGGHFFASFVKVIKTENEDRWDIDLCHFFSLFLGVQSAVRLKVGRTSYETPCIWSKCF